MAEAARSGAAREGAAREEAAREGAAGVFGSPVGGGGGVLSTELLLRKELGGLKLGSRAVGDMFCEGSGPLDRWVVPFIRRGRGGASAALKRCMRWYCVFSPLLCS